MKRNSINHKSYRVASFDFFIMRCTAVSLLLLLFSFLILNQEWIKGKLKANCIYRTNSDVALWTPIWGFQELVNVIEEISTIIKRSLILVKKPTHTHTKYNKMKQTEGRIPIETSSELIEMLHLESISTLLIFMELIAFDVLHW